MIRLHLRKDVIKEDAVLSRAEGAVAKHSGRQGRGTREALFVETVRRFLEGVVFVLEPSKRGELCVCGAIPDDGFEELAA